MKKVEVVAAVITKDNKILCVQRGSHKYPYLAHKWEFPGGKMEKGESQEETIRREIKEELSLEIQPIKHLLSHTHHYPDFSIELHTWLCTPLSENLQLNEHQTFAWLEAKDLKALDWAEADVAVVEILMKSPGQRIFLNSTVWSLTKVNGGMREFERTGEYPEYLLFYLEDYKKTWRVKLRNDSQNGILKMNKKPQFEYRYINGACWIRDINETNFTEIQFYSFIMQD